MNKSTFLFYLLLVLLANQSKAQNFITIPDANFSAWLNSNYPSCMNGNQLDTNCAALQSAQIINMSGYNIADLTGLEYFHNMAILDCSFNDLTILPNITSNLINLNCLGNQITQINNLPTSLVYLDCSSNPIGSFPAWPSGLLTLTLGNQIIDLPSFPALPMGLTSFNAYNCQLTDLPLLPAGLEILNCSNNPITLLPSLPIGLTGLIVSGCQLTNLPALPSTLNFLTCENNQLTSIPTLPQGIMQFYCSGNPLIQLPQLPSTINMLMCNNCQLTSMPPLPAALTYLECTNNFLTTLPPLPPLLNNLRCQNNQISYMPALPNSMLVFICSNNQITCFEPFPPSVPSLTLTPNPFTCLPNYIPSMGVTGLLVYPLCVDGDLVNNPYGCANALGATGFVFNDADGDCAMGGSEGGLKNIPMHLYDSIGTLVSSTISSGNGLYFLGVDTGVYSIKVDTLNKPYQTTCLNPGNDSTITFGPSNQLVTNVNFGMECKPGFDIGIQSANTMGWVFPGQSHTLNIAAGDINTWYGLSCATGVAGVLTINVSGPLSYISPASGALTPTSVFNNQFTYNIADFASVNMQQDFRLIFSTDTTAQAGDAICVNASITPLVGDHDTINNNYQFCYSVVNSYDPNKKDVYPGNVEPGYDGYFTYTIHFQNTGNAPAFNIRLADTLDAQLDLSTFELLNYSHAVQTYLVGNILTFRFNNILLPDSASNPEGSMGYVQYRIKALPGVGLGDVIENTAYIYFDFNAPIVTNTTSNEYLLPTALNAQLNENVFSVYPNPSDGLFYFKSNTKSIELLEVEVYNLIGELVQCQKNSNSAFILDLRSYNNGVYFVKMKQNSKTKSYKLVKH